MKCKNCGGECVKGLHVFRDGFPHVVERCRDCGRNPHREPFLAKEDSWENLPILINDLSDSEPCVVEGCQNKGTQLHHFAPRHLFETADDWPTGYLCTPHHFEWHKKTKTGYFAKRTK